MKSNHVGGLKRSLQKRNDSKINKRQKDRKIKLGMRENLKESDVRKSLSVYSCFEKGCRKKCSDNLERYCGWFLVHCFSKKFQRMAREAMDVCLRGLKESNKSRFDSYSVKNKCIDHIPYYLSGLRVHSFCDNLSRNSCTLVGPSVTSQTAKEIRLNDRSHNMISGAFHSTIIPI